MDVGSATGADKLFLVTPMVLKHEITDKVRISIPIFLRLLKFFDLSFEIWPKSDFSLMAHKLWGSNFTNLPIRAPVAYWPAEKTKLA